MSNRFQSLTALLFATCLMAQLPSKQPPPPAPPRAKPERPEPQEAPDTTNGNISAYVATEDGKPFGGAVVILQQSGKEERAAVTGDNGYVTFVWVKPGTYKAIFRREGYRDFVIPAVKVGGGQNVEIKGRLAKKK